METDVAGARLDGDPVVLWTGVAGRTRTDHRILDWTLLGVTNRMGTGLVPREKARHERPESGDWASGPAPQVGIMETC